MKLMVNGEQRHVDDGATVADVVGQLGPPRPGLAVAVNGEVVPRTAWAGRSLEEGDRVEVLAAIGGG